MSLFIVDAEKCNRDQICVENCPRALIEVTTQNDVPTPTADAQELCINCGHCVARASSPSKRSSCRIADRVND